jgi:hypothetical protein
MAECTQEKKRCPEILLKKPI